MTRLQGSTSPLHSRPSGQCKYFTHQSRSIHVIHSKFEPRIALNRDEQDANGRARFYPQFGRTDMNKIIAAVAISILCNVAFADPCMDSNVTPLGYDNTSTADELHLEEHGC